MIKSTLWCLSSLLVLGWGVTTLSLSAVADTVTPETSTTPIQPQTSPQTKTQATHLVLNLSERKVYAFENSKVLKSFPVAIGKKGWETPKGNFKVLQLTKNPVWQNPWNGKISAPGPNSPLGERWIGFWTDGKNFIGFHGTPGEHLIGQAVSHGCVRMRNADIKELFELVPMGIPVTVK